MGRARRARRIAQAAAYGGGVGVAGLGALGALGYGILRVEAMMARRIVGQHFEGAPSDSGTYGSGSGPAVRFVVLGDSTGVGMGADHSHQTIGATIATGIAAFCGRPVELTNVAVIGAESPDLDEQVERGLAAVPEPDVAVIMIGANDVTHRIDRSVAVRHLEMAVRSLREAGAEVVVGTCPDLGAIEPVPQPLRLLARRWSRDLAAAQTVAVVEAGGRAVSIGDLLSETFSAEPHVMFSKDRFHPSPAGYARVAAALLPTVSAALDLFGERSTPTAAQPASRRERRPARRRCDEGRHPARHGGRSGRGRRTGPRSTRTLGGPAAPHPPDRAVVCAVVCAVAAPRGPTHRSPPRTPSCSDAADPCGTRRRGRPLVRTAPS